MFRGKCLSVVLSLSIASVSFGADPNGDEDIDRGRSGTSALSSVSSGMFTLLEAMTHFTLLVGSGNHNLDSFFSRTLNSIPYNPLIEFQKSNRYLNRASGSIILSQALRLLPVANDYVCGMMTLTTEDGFYIDSVMVSRGSIQNDSQFEHIGNDIYVPKNRGITNLLLIKQTTGWSTAGSTYVSDSPIDFQVSVSDGRKSSTVHVVKSSCTLYSYGRASVSVSKGDDVSFCLTNSGTDGKVSTLTALTSAYGKPALIRIPGEACESY